VLAERDEWGSLAPPIHVAPPELSRLQRREESFWGSGQVVRKRSKKMQKTTGHPGVNSVL